MHEQFGSTWLRPKKPIEAAKWEKTLKWQSQQPTFHEESLGGHQMLLQSFGCVKVVRYLRVAVERAIQTNQLATVGARRTARPNVFGLFHQFGHLTKSMGEGWPILKFMFLPLSSREC